MTVEEIKNEVKAALCELLESANLVEGDIVVIGCSSSEIAGGDIGKASSPEIGAAVYEAVAEELAARRLYLAAQCCEHLNRALVVERGAACGFERVNAVPYPDAGGSFAAAAYSAIQDPVLVDGISAAAGLDIGDTLIGMHLRRVAVPVKLKNSAVGLAHVTAARTRPRFTGGIRAVDDERLL
ncbi:MAG: TIGR01440 family protein [Clostridiales bacterium]|nr:TIGR01440 family protein [Clostridiales bacterium]